MIKKIRIAFSSFLVLIICVGAFSSCTQKEKSTVYTKQEVGFQLEPPEKGEEIAIIHTSMGDVSVRFFPKAAPKAVENFITHAKNGYYNGLTFHRVMNDFQIQGGDPKGDGSGGDSIWGKDFDDEFDSKLFNLRGSLAMANAGSNTNASQFFINQTKVDSFQGKDYYVEETKKYKEQAKEYYEKNIATLKENYKNWEALIGEMSPTLAPDSDLVPQNVWDIYAKTGGNIYLDGMWRHDKAGHTVFGHVYEGMDVVDAIAVVEVEPKKYKPLEDVIINSIEIKTYE